MDSHPAPLPPEAYFDQRRRRHYHGTSTIPGWGWWVIGLVLASLAATAGYLYLGQQGQQTLVNSLPRPTVILCWTLFGIGGLVFYFLPSIITHNYNVRHKGGVLALNLCLNWSLAIWVIPMFVPALPQADVYVRWALVALTFIQWSAAMVWSIIEVERRQF